MTDDPPDLARRPALAVLGAGPAEAKRPAPADAGVSTAAYELIDAIAEEMGLGDWWLVLPGAPGPFHVSYKVTEVVVNDVVASLGFTTNAKERHFVNIECRVRVKHDGIDNGNFVIPQEEIDGSAGWSSAP